MRGPSGEKGRRRHLVKIEKQVSRPAKWGESRMSKKRYI